MSSHDDVHAHWSWLKWLKDKDEYSACNNTTADLLPCDPGHLRLKAARVDRVEMMSSPTGPALTTGSLEPLLSLLKKYNECNNGSRPVPESAFQSPMCGSHKATRFQKSTRRSSWPKDHDAAPFEKLKTWYWKPVGEFIEDHLHDKDLRLFADLYRVLRTGRKFVITKRGRLAWCSESCRVGDRVVVLGGGKVPFVLRRLEGGRYQLLGDAYVHCIMDGEAVSELEKKGRARGDITLV